MHLTHHMRSIASALAAAAIVPSLAASAADFAPPGDIPARPEEIVFAPLRFEPPSAAEYRHVLPCGVVVYLAPSRELPLVDLRMTFKGGAYLESADRTGLASMTGA